MRNGFVRSRNIVWVIPILLLVPIFGFADQPAAADDLGATCQQVSSSDTSCQTLTTAECQALLQKCADYYDSQSSKIAQDLSKTASQKNTLQNQVASLKKKITGLEAQIAQGTLMVKDLTLQIASTQSSITTTSQSIQESQRQISAILQSIHEQDQKPAFIVLLEGNLSDFFDNLTHLENLNSGVSSLLESTTNLKDYLEKQKNKIDTEKGQVQLALQVQSLQKQEQEQNKRQQEQYLKLTEAQFQQQQQAKNDADKKAAAIKSRIFDLLGVSKAPTFEEAYTIAKYVASVTGVRPAFVMAVLTQESNLGKNVGQCYLKNAQTGDGVKISTGAFAPKTMAPNRDVPVYLNLIDKLNKSGLVSRDPFATPVSCVIYYSGKPYGWGGAMGPAQFIPSTWVNLGYGDKVTALTGRVADPWNIRDAFLANGLLLKDLGAQSNEFNAAMKYYCGGNCSKYDQFYGRSVVNIANQYEQDIQAIGG